MKKSCLYLTSVLILLLALVSPAFSQTTQAAAQTTWFTIATLSGNVNPLVTSNGPVTYQYGIGSGTTLKGVNCAVAPGCWLAPVTATLSSFPTLWSTFPSDPAPGIAKVFQLAETCTVQTGTIGGVAYTVPALTSCNYTLTFIPNASYSFTVANIPPATSTSPLTFALTIQIGTQAVPLVCTYGTTLVTAATATLPVSESAVFTCIPETIAGK